MRIFVHNKILNLHIEINSISSFNIIKISKNIYTENIINNIERRIMYTSTQKNYIFLIRKIFTTSITKLISCRKKELLMYLFIFLQQFIKSIFSQS